MDKLEIKSTFINDNELIRKLIDVGIDRNILCYDVDANTGQFTKRLLGLLKSSIHEKLTNVLISPFGFRQILQDWATDNPFAAIEEIDGTILVGNVLFHKSYELGKNSRGQNYFKECEGTMYCFHQEILIGVDLSKPLYPQYVTPLTERIVLGSF